MPFLLTPIGAALFIPGYAIWVSLLLPGVWASILAGALYGPWIGSLLVFFGACLGAEISFFLGRSILRDWVKRRLAQFPKFQAVEQAVTGEGLKLVLLTRLSPAFPFGLLNFVYGISEISFWDYTIGLIGILPGTIFFCGLGALAGDLTKLDSLVTESTDPKVYPLRVIGLIATLLVVWLVTRVARRALKDYEN